jgi:transketolase
MEEITEVNTEPIVEPTNEPTIEPIEPIEPVRKQKQIPTKSPGENNECANIWHLTFIRNTRNSYLNLTDKYVLPDYPITDEKKEIIINYRQYLRELININKEAILNGENIEILPIPT